MTRPMLRQLLQDRFALRARFETRTLPVYALTVARADALGPNLRRVQMDRCSHREPLPDGMMPCSTRNQPRGTLIAQGANWPNPPLHREMAAAIDRLVVDRTGLSGQFDITLEWGDPVAQRVRRVTCRAGTDRSFSFVSRDVLVQIEFVPPGRVTRS